MLVKVKSAYFICLPSEPRKPEVWLNLAQVSTIQFNREEDENFSIRVQSESEGSRFFSGRQAQTIMQELKKIQINLKEENNE